MREANPGPGLMPGLLRKGRARVPGALLVILAAAVLAAAAPQEEKKDPNAAAADSKEKAAAAAGATYVGSETCQPCHDDIYTPFMKRNRHAIVETANKYSKFNKQSCESCHGPGSAHAESGDPAFIANPSKMAATLADKTCLGCHLNTPTQFGRVHGGHARSAVSCTACHSVHSARKTAALDCTSCHADQWAKFNRPFGHTLGRNAMSCVDCHNPHGGVVQQSSIVRSVRSFGANEPGCFKCHGDKRGPFTFEHAPMRLEGCATCHDPHNSANPRMLNRHEVWLTCMECHSNLGVITSAQRNPETPLGGIPPAFHDLRSRRIQQCTVCHIKIHGSHANRDFLR